jgi:hypothetical protein
MEWDSSNNMNKEEVVSLLQYLDDSLGGTLSMVFEAADLVKPSGTGELKEDHISVL